MTDDDIEECFEMLERQGDGLEALVRDLLDLSMIEHGEARLDAHAVSVEGWIMQATEATPPPYDVTLHQVGGQGLVVRGNSDQLNRVVVNLLTNAYRYARTSVWLRVTLRRRRDRRGRGRR